MLQLSELARRSDFELDELFVSPSRRRVRGPSGERQLQPIIMHILLLMLEREGQVVTRDELFQHCWGGYLVGDDSLNRGLSKVRQILADVAPGKFEVETVPRTGYRLTRTASAKEMPRIAVLPLKSLRTNPDEAYFAEGMVDEIVTALSRTQSLMAVSSESSSALKEKGWSEQEVASRLGVDYLLKGSVGRSGGRVRLRVKLIDARMSVQIWADRFDYELKDIFELQDRIAFEVAASVEPRVEHAERRRVARQPVESLGCYDLYLRAAAMRATCRQAEVIAALELLDRALEIDPNFAPALAQAAGCHSQLYSNRWDSERGRHRVVGLALADRALIHGGEDASVLAQVANAVIDLEGDLDRALALAKRAIALNPCCARAWFVAGLALLIGHDGEAAVEHLSMAARLDPISSLNDVIRVHIGIGLYAQGRPEDALRAIKGTNHRTSQIHLILSALYGHLGMPEQSRAEARQATRASGISIEEMIATRVPKEESRAMLRSGINAGRAGDL